MSVAPKARSASQRIDAVLREVGLWRDSLINLTGRNRLLNFRPRPTSTVTIVGPGLTDVLSGLTSQSSFSFAFAPTTDSDVIEQEDPWPAVLPRSPRGPVLQCAEAEVPGARALRTLARRSTSEFMDKGLWILYLAFGTLRWRDVDDTPLISPLLLVPVKLESPGVRQPLQLALGEDDPQINPALALKLRDFEVTLPDVDADLGTEYWQEFAAQVTRAIAAHPGWELREDLHLSYFSFHKEAMYRDLLENAEQIADHPLISAFALGDSAGPAATNDLFDPIDDDRIDELAPPEGTPLVLDADSSQRACVSAAVAGHSFIIDGPPGTGKSQTITNVIGALLRAGKTVLFVSEKAAALDVVRNRLANVGLDAYLMELHSHKATRREVATALGHALEHQPVPPTGLSDADRYGVAQRRRELSDYAAAMNQKRTPLGYSLHEVLGYISKLNDAPAAPAADLDAATLTPEKLASIRSLADSLSRAWRPALQGPNYAWRGVTRHGSMHAELQTAINSLSELQALTAHNADAAQQLALARPSDANRLAQLITHMHSRDARTPLEWLTVEDPTAVHTTLLDLDQRRDTARRAAAEAKSASGIDWHQLPVAAVLPLANAQALTSLDPPGVEPDTLTASQCTALASHYAGLANKLETATSELATINTRLGLPASTTFVQASQTLQIAKQCLTGARPPRAWITQEGPARAQAAATELERVVEQVTAAREQAAPHFTARALDLDLVALQSRFANVHRGLRRLGGAYRADKRQLAEISTPGVRPRHNISHLADAITWQQASRDLAHAQQRHAATLAPLYTGLDTDWGQLRACLQTATLAVTLAGAADLTRLADNLALDGQRPHDLHDLVTRTEETLTDAHATLGTAASPPAPPTLLQGDLDTAILWLRAHAAPLESIRTIIAATTATTGRDHTWASARHLLTLQSAADTATQEWNAHTDAYAALLGDWFAGENTDVAAASSAADWAVHARRLASRDPESLRALTAPQVKALQAATPTPMAARLQAQWEHARDAVLGCFAPERHADLSSELDDYEDGTPLLDELRTDSGGPDEWFTYQQTTADLTSHGLTAAVQYCVENQTPAELVPRVVERATLTAWVESIISTDGALTRVRSTDRDALVQEFRELDKRMIDRAVSEIISHANERRPTTTVGQSMIIRRQAELQRRHMPVRELLGRARDVITSIKPCFMMSPLSVSQYLPPDLRFDVVIFDEASQVTPADAINCIYRGDTLIIAGDQKQLPPTDFFAAASSDGSDEWVEGESDAQEFKSVLDIAKSSVAMRSLTLRWHYRSRHEDLITFSNSSFYGGQLITFPGAVHDADHVGVELIPVRGTYRRGTSRDNPIEAAAVAERVLHHFDTRPDLTLGVVAFSEAQATAIESAVDQARLARPDLDSYFHDDRLDGFFVKNLESVQGDERDVMIFSIGYGPDEAGKIWNNFGPLNKPGGWRRLNVAVTRARHRNEIVSSISAADVADSSNESVRQFRRYLDYAARGPQSLALDDTGSLGAPESPFEESVLEVIRSWGYQVVPQVGTAGYRIDIAVRHPDQPGAYMLAVECDGYMYHSSRAARDRDRLRQEVLEGLGWRLHRIWGTAWYRARDHEEKRLRDALERAMRAPIGGLITGSPPRSRTAVELEAIELPEIPDWAEPYRVATVPRLPRWVNVSEPGNGPSMAPGISAVVEVETPIHYTLLLQRLRDAWNMQRLGSRIRANIDDAIRIAHVLRDGDFFTTTEDPDPAIRTPTAAVARTIAQVPDREIELALLGYARDAAGITRDELSTAVARLFGWGRRGTDIQARLDQLIDGLITYGALVGDDNRLTYVELDG